MRFGHVDAETLREIDFKIPNFSASKEILEKLSETKDFKLYMGAPAWGVKDWIGKIYPKGANTQNFLSYYSKNFNSVELNTTYYRLPDRNTIKLWRSQVPGDFKFCPKISKNISHSVDINNNAAIAEYFSDVKYFEENLGIIFMQLNENFGVESKSYLLRFLDRVPENIKLAIEFRHPSWFYKGENIFKVLEQKNITLIITDVSGRRDVLYPHITSERLMIRWVGNNLDQTDFTRIDLWIEKIQKLKELGIKELYFFIHETDDVMCPEVGEYFSKKVNEQGIYSLPKVEMQYNEQINFI